MGEIAQKITRELGRAMYEKLEPTRLFGCAAQWAIHVIEGEAGRYSSVPFLQSHVYAPRRMPR